MPNSDRTMFLIFLICIFPNYSFSNDCEELLVENEFIQSPGYPDGYPPSEDCIWTLAAPTGKLIEVKIDHVKLAQREDSLLLTLDDRTFKLHHLCASVKSSKCLEIPTVAKIFVLKFRSGNQNVTNINGTFLIRFKLFDPKMCEKPKSPMNGYTSGTNYSVNASIKYHCYPPYDLVGNADALCKSQLLSLPQWSNEPPRCVVFECPKERVIKRKAGKGAIANPGYPDNYIKGNQNCKWTISAKDGYQIILNFQYFSLPNVHTIKGRDYNFLDIYDSTLSKKIRFDGNKNPPNITSQRNFLSIVLSTDNLADQTAKANGFYIDYAAVPVICPDPGIPLNGKRIGELFSYNKTVEYLCEEGYDLLGESEIYCSTKGQWSHPRPQCHQPLVNDSSTVQPYLISSTEDLSSFESLTTKDNKAEIIESRGNNQEDELVTDLSDDPINGSSNHVMIIGIVIPTVISILLLFVYLYYRKKHPVRMLFGRRFSTFENPMYSRAPTAAPKL